MLNTNYNVPCAVPVAPIGNSNGGSGGNMWGDGAWWIIILLIFAWGGLGGNRLGGGGQGAADNYILASDFSQLSRQIADTTAMTERKLDGINNGICDLGYNQLAQMNGLNMNIANSTAALTNTITTNGYENRLGQQLINQQIANCCCDLKQQVGDVNYNIANQANMLDRTIADKFCQTNYNVATNTRDIVDSQNAGTQAILARLDALESTRKDEKIAELQAKNFDLRLAASQAQQNNYLVRELGPKCPEPAYLVCNPNTPLNYSVNYASNGCCGC